MTEDERINKAYHILRTGKFVEDSSCPHDLVTIRQNKKWGYIDWGICIECGYKTNNATDISESHRLRQQRLDYWTRHAGHRTGAKVERGNPTMLGRDYED